MKPLAGFAGIHKKLGHRVEANARDARNAAKAVAPAKQRQDLGTSGDAELACDPNAPASRKNVKRKVQFELQKGDSNLLGMCYAVAALKGRSRRPFAAECSFFHIPPAFRAVVGGFHTGFCHGEAPSGASFPLGNHLPSRNSITPAFSKDGSAIRMDDGLISYPARAPAFMISPCTIPEG